MNRTEEDHYQLVVNMNTNLVAGDVEMLLRAYLRGREGGKEGGRARRRAQVEQCSSHSMPLLSPPHAHTLTHLLRVVLCYSVPRSPLEVVVSLL